MNAHGGKLVSRITPRPRTAPTEFVELSQRNFADLELIATGVYSPLEGFMGQQDHASVLEQMRLADGTIWSIPITLSVEREVATTRLGLKFQGAWVGMLELEEEFRPNRMHEAEQVYRTQDPSHPGVAALFAESPVNLAGRITLFDVPKGEFPPYHYPPLETRQIFASRGWKTVVGFQTRNPIHRAHEYLHKVALEQLDGLFLNPLVGQTKTDDLPASLRMRSYEVLLQHYYPKERVLLGVYPATMRYGGPREAVLHAISRKNYGCTHFIVGRDHAGVGNFYGSYDAQQIFDQFSSKELGIEILKFEHTFFCKACAQVVSQRTCPHPPEEHLVFSGTEVRKMLQQGKTLPGEFIRPEVAAVLLNHG